MEKFQGQNELCHITLNVVCCSIRLCKEIVYVDCVLEYIFRDYPPHKLCSLDEIFSIKFNKWNFFSRNLGNGIFSFLKLHVSLEWFSRPILINFKRKFSKSNVTEEAISSHRENQLVWPRRTKCFYRKWLGVNIIDHKFIIGSDVRQKLAISCTHINW